MIHCPADAADGGISEADAERPAPSVFLQLKRIHRRSVSVDTGTGCARTDGGATHDARARFLLQELVALLTAHLNGAGRTKVPTL